MPFGAPLMDLTLDDLTKGDAWSRRLVLHIEGVTVPVLGREDFVTNKRASGRPKDRLDLELLGD
jgi:hypothetical protein